MAPDARQMADFWDARAREDAFYFVDSEQSYGAPDVERFFAEGERTLDLMLETSGAQIGQGDDVVEVGCGLGRLSRALALRGARVDAIDVSAEMLARARELNVAHDAITWHQGNGTSLAPVADSSADAVISHVVFQHIPDPEITYGYVREMGRVLRPGGFAVFQVSDDPSVHEATAPAHSRLKALLGRAPKGQRHPAWRGSAVDLGRLRMVAGEAGMRTAGVVGAGTQYCLVHLVKEGS